jgi:ligand-binding SRPBCC domain-containing protein
MFSNSTTVTNHKTVVVAFIQKLTILTKETPPITIPINSNNKNVSHRLSQSFKIMSLPPRNQKDNQLSPLQMSTYFSNFEKYA